MSQADRTRNLPRPRKCTNCNALAATGENSDRSACTRAACDYAAECEKGRPRRTVRYEAGAYVRAP